MPSLLATLSYFVFRIAHQSIGVMPQENQGKLTYELTGKLVGPAFKSRHFKSNGDLSLPAEIFGRSK